jgi:hypothetical protein
MEEAKRKRLEEKLRQMFMDADQSEDKSRLPTEIKTSGPRVIRRRKGTPDMQVS